MSGATLIVVPVLRRPHRVAPLMESVTSATPEPHRLLFVANEDDHAELAALRAAGADHLTVGGVGSYPCKVNAAYRASSEPLLFLAADDLSFHPGWLSAAMGHLRPGVGVVGTNDLGNSRVMSGKHSTHSLVTRAYADNPGGAAGEPETVLHEGYRHNFCDDELVGLATKRGAFVHAADSIVEHLHPNWAKGQTDEVYDLGQQAWRRDKALSVQRRAAWT